MQVTQASMYASLKAAEAFLNDHADKLGTIPDTSTRKELVQAIEELRVHSTTQEESHTEAKGSTKRQLMLRKILIRDHMAPIAAIATKANLPDSPEVRELRMPKGRVMGERLFQAADAMAASAGKRKELFIGAGLAPDFVETLIAANEAMIDTLVVRTSLIGQGAGASKSVREKLSDGRAVIAVLDKFIQSALHADTALLTEWNSVKRVQGIQRRTKPAGTTTPVTSTPAATPPASTTPPATSPAATTPAPATVKA